MSSWITVLWVMGIMAAIAATVLFCIFLMPEKKAAKMPKFLRVIRDILNMKDLYLETVLKVVYIFLTLACVIVGVLMFAFGFGRSWYGDIEWYGGYGLLIAIGGPIVLRLLFEVGMMFILLVKNTMQINNKLKSQNVEETPAEPAQEKPGVVIVQSYE